MSALLPLEEAQKRLLALAPELGIEEVPVEAALGRVLAGDLLANRTQPPADLSAMDGYAIAGIGPWAIIGESRAGAPFKGALKHGEATRISTGAHMPEGSDAVLIKENAADSGTKLSASEVPEVGAHVRRQGFDFASGDQVLRAGDPVTPGRMAFSIAAGHGTLAVRARPRIAVLDSGDELARDPAACGPHQIPASNGAMIAAMVAPLIGEASRIGPVADDAGALAEALVQAEDADILITSGGASVGDHDLVQQALIDWGATIDFWKVAIKPGKPLMVATRGNQVVLGLPGNPVSSFVTCYLFALPLIRASMSHLHPLPQPQRLTSTMDLPAVGPRQEFLRGISDGTSVSLAASQDSSALRSLAAANCLIDRPAEAPALRPDEPVAVYSLQNG